jgi:hypothetical protein
LQPHFFHCSAPLAYLYRINWLLKEVTSFLATFICLRASHKVHIHIETNRTLSAPSDMSVHLLCIPHKCITRLIQSTWLGPRADTQQLFFWDVRRENTQSGAREPLFSSEHARILTWTITLDCLSRRWPFLLLRTYTELCLDRSVAEICP